jgi:hypothetical protein
MLRMRVVRVPRLREVDFYIFQPIVQDTGVKVGRLCEALSAHPPDDILSGAGSPWMRAHPPSRRCACSMRQSKFPISGERYNASVGTSTRGTRSLRVPLAVGDKTRAAVDDGHQEQCNPLSRAGARAHVEVKVHQLQDVLDFVAPDPPLGQRALTTRICSIQRRTGRLLRHRGPSNSAGYSEEGHGIGVSASANTTCRLSAKVLRSTMSVAHTARAAPRLPFSCSFCFCSS